MRWVRYGLAVALLVVVEGVMPPAFRFAGVAPDLLLGLVIGLALDARSWRVFGPIWGVGLVRDLTSIGPFGLYAFLFGGIGLALYRLREEFYLDHGVTALIAGVIAAALVGIGAWVHLRLSGGAPAFSAALVRVVVGALLSGVAAGFTVSALRRTGWLAGFAGSRRGMR